MQDYFPIKNRSTANSLIQAGNYVGVGLSSLSILLISQYGWRGMYGFYAAFSIILGFVVMFFVKEPRRGNFLDEANKIQDAEMKE